MPIFRLSPPFLAGTNRVTLQMLQVLLALIPAVIAMVYFFGPAVLINIVIAVVVAVSSAHRQASFEAGQWLLNTLKEKGVLPLAERLISLGSPLGRHEARILRGDA